MKNKKPLGKADNVIKNEPQDKKQVSTPAQMTIISTLVSYCLVSRRYGQAERIGQQEGRVKEED